MCYRCQWCRKVKNGIVQLTRIVEIRPKTYSFTKKKKIGWEIVREVKVCPKCYDKYMPVKLGDKVIIS